MSNKLVYFLIFIIFLFFWKAKSLVFDFFVVQTYYGGIPTKNQITSKNIRCANLLRRNSHQEGSCYR